MTKRNELLMQASDFSRAGHSDKAFQLIIDILRFDDQPAPTTINVSTPEIPKWDRTKLLEMIQKHLPQFPELDNTDAIEEAWGIIANVSQGNWQLENPEWRAAAERWRDRWLPMTAPKKPNTAEADAHHQAEMAGTPPPAKQVLGEPEYIASVAGVNYSTQTTEPAPPTEELRETNRNLQILLQDANEATIKATMERDVARHSIVALKHEQAKDFAALLQGRRTTPEECQTWGTCLVCGSGPGEPCDSSVGPTLGTTVSGKRPSEGAHLVRLQAAPRMMQLITR